MTPATQKKIDDLTLSIPTEQALEALLKREVNGLSPLVLRRLNEQGGRIYIYSNDVDGGPAFQITPETGDERDWEHMQIGPLVYKDWKRGLKTEAEETRALLHSTLPIDLIGAYLVEFKASVKASISELIDADAQLTARLAQRRNLELQQSAQRATSTSNYDRPSGY